jgi:hypothetical protein
VLSCKLNSLKSTSVVVSLRYLSQPGQEFVETISIYRFHRDNPAAKLNVFRLLLNSDTRVVP